MMRLRFCLAYVLQRELDIFDGELQFFVFLIIQGQRNLFLQAVPADDARHAEGCFAMAIIESVDGCGHREETFLIQHDCAGQGRCDFPDARIGPAFPVEDIGSGVHHLLADEFPVQWFRRGQ